MTTDTASWSARDIAVSLRINQHQGKLTIPAHEAEQAAAMLDSLTARVAALEAELEPLRAAHYDATHGISATIRAGELEALETENSLLREKLLAAHCRANAFVGEFDRRVKAESRVAALEAENAKLRDRLEDTTAALVNLRQAALRILRDKPVRCFDEIDEHAENAIMKNRAALEGAQ